MGIASIAKSKGLGQMAHGHEMSLRVVQENSVSELKGQGGRLCPCPEAHVSLPRIDVWIVNFGPAGIPDLERLLE